AAVVDGAPGFLYCTGLGVLAPDFGVAHSAFDLAGGQIVVFPFSLLRESAGGQFGGENASCWGDWKVPIGQRRIRVVRDVESHGAIVVDRNPGASAGRKAHERNEAIGREQSLGHTPVVSSLADYATGAVAKAVVGVVHYDLGRPVARLQP